MADISQISRNLDFGWGATCSQHMIAWEDLGNWLLSHLTRRSFEIVKALKSSKLWNRQSFVIEEALKSSKLCGYKIAQRDQDCPAISRLPSSRMVPTPIEADLKKCAVKSGCWDQYMKRAIIKNKNKNNKIELDVLIPSLNSFEWKYNQILLHWSISTDIEFYFALLFLKCN